MYIRGTELTSGEHTVTSLEVTVGLPWCRCGAGCRPGPGSGRVGGGMSV